MGIDIYSDRGIIFTVDEFLKVINGKNKSNVVSVCHLKTSMKLSDIREIIASSIEVEGEVSKYGSCYVTDAEYVQDLFRRILDACPEADNLPHIKEVTAWGSGRNNGWEVPKGIACVVFDSDDCYERSLSEKGKAVKKMFGHCDETEWTEMSC
jgi:hypothetical protein